MNNEELKYRDIDPKTYQDYIALKNANSKHYLMISELIDNSISSKETYEGDLKNWSSPLIIDITFNTSSESSSQVGVDRFRNHNNIKVSDNAYGMNEDELIRALKINKKNKNGKSNKNVHGRGLKQSSFFFGFTVHVDTYNGYDEAKTISLDAIKNKYDDIVKFKTSNSPKMNRGTDVVISNLHNTRTITKKRLEGICKALSARYEKFIDSGLLKINFRGTIAVNGKVNIAITSLGDIDNNYFIGINTKIIGDRLELLPYKPSTWTLGEFLKKSPIKDIPYEECRSIYMDRLKNVLTSKKNAGNINSEVMYEAANHILNWFNTRDDSSEMRWEQECNIGLHDQRGNAIPLSIEFFYNGDESKWRGISVIEGNRAIMHGPIENGEQTTYTGYEKGIETGSTYNSFGGVMDITPFQELNTTTDKSVFTLDEGIREELDMFIFSVWRAFNVFVIMFRNRKSDIKNKTKIGSEEVRSAFSNRFLKQHYENNVESTYIKKTSSDQEDQMEIETFLGEGKGEFTIKIVMDSDEDTRKILTRVDFINDKKGLIVYFNNDASIWNTANRALIGETLYTELILPVIYQLSILIINNEILEQKEIKDGINNEKIIEFA